MISYDFSGFLMISHDYSWLVLISHDFSWLLMISHDFSWLLMISHGFSWLFMITHDYSWLWDRVGYRVWVQFFHQLGPYESYGGLPATIRRRISIRVFLDGSRVQLKQLLHQKFRKSFKIIISRIFLIFDAKVASTRPGTYLERRGSKFCVGWWSGHLHSSHMDPIGEKTVPHMVSSGRCVWP